MESDGTTDRTTAAAQLATLRADRAALADRLEHSGSWWPWDVGLGLWLFLVIGAQSLQSNWARAGAVVLALLGVRVAYVAFRRATGVWVDGWRRGGTRRAVWAWVAFALVVYAVGFVAEDELDLRGALAVAGAVLGVALAAFNRWWMRIYVAELRGER